MNRSQVPIAIFSNIEIEKYQRYANFGIAVEVVDSDPWTNRPQKVKSSNFFDRVGERIIERTENQHKKAVESLNQRVAQNPGLAQNPFEFKESSRFYSRAQAFKKNPRFTGKLAVGAAGLGALGLVGAAGVGGSMFMRRRRTKNGKVVVEQVRR